MRLSTNGEPYMRMRRTMPGICFALGSRLLMHDEETGCALVEYALQYEGENIAKGCEALRDYYSRNGREEESCAWNLCLIEESEVQTVARNERTRYATLRDKFQPHGLSKETLADLVAQLRGVSGLRNAYFIKKRVKHFQDHPLYVLGYSVAGLFPSRRNKRAAEVLSESTDGAVSGRDLVCQSRPGKSSVQAKVQTGQRNEDAAFQPRDNDNKNDSQEGVWSSGDSSRNLETSRSLETYCAS